MLGGSDLKKSESHLITIVISSVRTVNTIVILSLGNKFENYVLITFN